MKILKIFLNVIYSVIVVLFVVIALALASASLNLPVPYKLYTVISGSMEPAIHTGSVVMVTPSKTYRKGDIITFWPSSTAADSTVTHRIADLKTVDGRPSVVTKGDANNTTDLSPTPVTDIIGKLVVAIPYLGYPVAFAKTQLGLILLVIIPTTLIVYSEFQNIIKEAKKLLAARRTPEHDAQKDS
ncbi:MAG TPA: signal peptidase I [Patescibacteria group bacterium]